MEVVYATKAGKPSKTNKPIVSEYYHGYFTGVCTQFIHEDKAYCLELGTIETLPELGYMYALIPLNIRNSTRGYSYRTLDMLPEWAIDIVDILSTHIGDVAESGIVVCSEDNYKLFEVIQVNNIIKGVWLPDCNMPYTDSLVGG